VCLNQDYFYPFPCLFFIYYWYYNHWSLINIHYFIYICLDIIIDLIIIIILFYIFIIISIIWKIIIYQKLVLNFILMGNQNHYTLSWNRNVTDKSDYIRVHGKINVKNDILTIKFWQLFLTIWSDKWFFIFVHFSVFQNHLKYITSYGKKKLLKYHFPIIF